MGVGVMRRLAQPFPQSFPRPFLWQRRLRLSQRRLQLQRLYRDCPSRRLRP
jgi:hypothetical protein